MASASLPGVWRLRLPLPWPGVPHCNAWAVAAGDGIVLFDTGMHEPGSLAHLERALGQVNLSLEHVRLLVCTHAHSDHYGQAADDRRPRRLRAVDAPQPRAHDARGAGPRRGARAPLEVARQCGVPEEPLRALRRGAPRPGLRHRRHHRARPRRCCPASRSRPTSGTWQVYETPGHAPSHVCLFQPERRMLISGDHLLGRVSLYYDFGYSPDPAGEFLRSLDVVEQLDARLCLAGHGRTFTDVQAPHRRQPRARARAHRQGPRASSRASRITAFDAVPRVYGRGDHADERELVADRDALLPHAPRAHGPRRADRRRTGALA